MDVGALVAALIGAVGGAVVTGIGAYLRSRTTRRTAARLVYAELERNSAAVAFYRRRSMWPASTTSRTAWENYSETLARDRKTDIFQKVSQGYAALEDVAYIAREKMLPTEEIPGLLQGNVEWLCTALRCAGEAARIPDDEINKAVDRLIGPGLLAPGASRQALRSLQAPGTAYDDQRLGKDSQPGHMSGYVRTESDNGGVHINSGIPNRAFYLLAASLGGYAWEKAGMIWYRALTSKAVTPTANFRSFAGLTVAVARRDHIDDPSVASAVEAAWQEVGVTPHLTKRALDLVPTSSSGR
jgi:hypothetical protein